LGEDWSRVEVAEDGFQAKFFHRVMFYGDVQLGSVQKEVEITKGFVKHSGINDATLRNVTVGNDCLIEKVGNYINNYTIGDDCLISNISVMETTEGATYGEGNLISVLNEVGDGNVIFFHDLNSQFAAFMVKHFNDKDLKNAIHCSHQSRTWNDWQQCEDCQHKGDYQHGYSGRLRDFWCKSFERLYHSQL